MEKFQPDQRLHNPGEFSVVLKQRGVIRGSCFELHHCSSGQPKARLGLIIPKRFAKRAVLRNLIKRQVREVFRTCAGGLPVEDFVVRLVRTAKGSPESTTEQRPWVKSEAVALFQRVAPVKNE